MATQSRITQPDDIPDKPAWSTDTASEFEPDLPPGNPASSGSNETTMSEDLDLYDPVYIY